MSDSEPTTTPTPTPPDDGRSRPTTMMALVGVGILVLALLGIRVMSPDESGETDDAANASTETTAPAFGGAPVPPLPDETVRLSEDELGGLRFRDVTEEAGLSAPQASRDVIELEGMTSGAAVADVTGDGYPDIYLSRVGLPSSLYVNQGDGTFVDRAAEMGVLGPDPAQGSSAAAFADVDADGDLDLFVAGHGTAPPVLYLNGGDGRFAAATDSGIQIPAAHPEWGSQLHGTVFHDVDRDGSLDLLVTHWDQGVVGERAIESVGGLDALFERDSKDPDACQRMVEFREAGLPRDPAAGPNRSRLFLNNGDGTFRDATTEMGLDLATSYAFTPQFADVDRDGWDDLFVTGDACTSRVFRNVEGRHFEEVTHDLGVGTDENGMGSVLRDVDGDGLIDWFVTSISYPTEDGSCPIWSSLARCSGNRLYLGQDDGTMVDATDELGLRHGWWGWGAAIEDFANDGRLEVVMTNGYVDHHALEGDPSTTAEGEFYRHFLDDPMRFWVPVDGSYVDAAEQVGLDSRAVGHALVPLDYDLDGRLDVLIANTKEPPQLYRNESTGDRSWLTILLDDPGNPGNRRGVGAHVVVRPRDGEAARHGWITTSGSYESQRPPELHVGLGDVDRVAAIEVWWPGATEPQVLTDVPARQRLEIRRR